LKKEVEQSAKQIESSKKENSKLEKEVQSLKKEKEELKKQQTQQIEMLKTENYELIWDDEAIRRIAKLAVECNQQVENIGARRLVTIIEKFASISASHSEGFFQGDILSSEMSQGNSNICNKKHLFHIFKMNAQGCLHYQVVNQTNDIIYYNGEIGTTTYIA